MKIIVDNYVSDYDQVKRTWKERIFTLPWRPFEKFKLVYNPKMYVIGNSIICSHCTEIRLKQVLSDDSIINPKSDDVLEFLRST